MHLKKEQKGFKVSAKDMAQNIADYTAEYNKWLIKMFTLYIEQNANPKIKGKITDRKLNKAGIKIIIQDNQTWLEQNGKRISKVLQPKPYEFDLNQYSN